MVFTEHVGPTESSEAAVRERKAENKKDIRKDWGVYSYELEVGTRKRPPRVYR